MYSLKDGLGSADFEDDYEGQEINPERFEHG